MQLLCILKVGDPFKWHAVQNAWFQKMPIPIGNSEGVTGYQKAKYLKGSDDQNWNLQKGSNQKTSMREVWILCFFFFGRMSVRGMCKIIRNNPIIIRKYQESNNQERSLYLNVYIFQFPFSGFQDYRILDNSVIKMVPMSKRKRGVSLSFFLLLIYFLKYAQFNETKSSKMVETMSQINCICLEKCTLHKKWKPFMV